MAGARAVDVLIVSLGSTAGLRAADDELRASLQRAGASVALARTATPRPRRTLMLTDLAWARAARVAAVPAARGAAAAAVERGGTRRGRPGNRRREPRPGAPCASRALRRSGLRGREKGNRPR